MKLNTKKQKKYIVTMIICFILATSLLFISFLVTNLFILNESNTVKHEATFERVEQIDKDYHIYVDEYKCSLILISEAIIDNGIDYLFQLDKGETVYFSTFPSAEDFLNDPLIEHLAIVTLKTDEKDIITFDSYRNFENKQIANAKATGIVFAIILVLAGIYCILKINGVVFFKSIVSRGDEGQGGTE